MRFAVRISDQYAQGACNVCAASLPPNQPCGPRSRVQLRVLADVSRPRPVSSNTQRQVGEIQRPSPSTLAGHERHSEPPSSRFRSAECIRELAIPVVLDFTRALRSHVMKCIRKLLRRNHPTHVRTPPASSPELWVIFHSPVKESFSQTFLLQITEEFLAGLIFGSLSEAMRSEGLLSQSAFPSSS